MHDKPAPKGWPRISSALYYDDPARAIQWLEEVFGFETRVKVTGPNGEIHHSELEFGDGLIMVGSTAKSEGKVHRKSPQSIGFANTQALCVFVDDVDAHYAKTKAAGAEILMKPETKDYGDRGYMVADLEGHAWYFGQRVDDAAAVDSRKPFVSKHK